MNLKQNGIDGSLAVSSPQPENLEWSVISAVNDEAVLQAALLNSPGIAPAKETILQRGFPTASAAYNDAIKKSKTDFLVFVHQDVYLPEGWIESVKKAVESLSRQDPNWGVLGVWGAVDEDQRVGYLYWTGDLGWEEPFEGVKEVVSLDEVILIFRKSSGLVFDENLPGWHLYGADICMAARHAGKKCYAISAFCIHNTNTHSNNLLPWQFWKCYWFIRRRWQQSLPIDTPCTRVTFWCWPVLHWHLVYLRNLVTQRPEKKKRVDNPAELYRQLQARGILEAAAVAARIASQAPEKKPLAADHSVKLRAVSCSENIK